MNTIQVCVKATIKYQDKFLILVRSKKDMLQKGYDVEKNGLYEGVYDLPGGGIEFGETPDKALRRELLEEIGLDTKNNFPISRTWSITEDNFHLIGITYLVELKNKIEIILSDEHDDFLWLTYDEIINDSLYPSWLKEEINTINK